MSARFSLARIVDPVIDAVAIRIHTLDVNRAGIKSAVIGLVAVHAGGIAGLLKRTDRHRVAKHGHRVAEVVAGPGIVAIHDVLARIEGKPVLQRDDKALWADAMAGTDRLAVAAMDRFCLSLGSVAGSCPRAALIAAWTSRAAPLMSRSRPNCRLIRTVPTALFEVISVTSAIWPRWRSSGVATVVATTAGLAPGSCAVTEITGKSTLGSGATGSWK